MMMMMIAVEKNQPDDERKGPWHPSGFTNGNTAVGVGFGPHMPKEV
jgi:hypothetical protein